MSVSYSSKCLSTLNLSCRNISVVLGRILVLSTAFQQCQKNVSWLLIIKNLGALLTDMSKAFNCLPHDLLVAKLNVYEFSLPALRLVLSYLSNRKQRTKTNFKFNSSEEILFGVPQGSILGAQYKTRNTGTRNGNVTMEHRCYVVVDVNQHSQVVDINQHIRSWYC